jgi:protein phosphatase
MIQLSKDDTYVQFLIDNAKITEAESHNHPKRNILTKALGTSNELRATFTHHESRFEANDTLFLCSDGLYEYVDTDELKSILKDDSITDVANFIIELAKQRGGHDNISVLIVEAASAMTESNFKRTQKIV